MDDVWSHLMPKYIGYKNFLGMMRLNKYHYDMVTKNVHYKILHTCFFHGFDSGNDVVENHKSYVLYGLLELASWGDVPTINSIPIEYYIDDYNENNQMREIYSSLTSIDALKYIDDKYDKYIYKWVCACIMMGDLLMSEYTIYYVYERYDDLKDEYMLLYSIDNNLNIDLLFAAVRSFKRVGQLLSEKGTHLIKQIINQYGETIIDDLQNEFALIIPNNHNYRSHNHYIYLPKTTLSENELLSICSGW